MNLTKTTHSLQAMTDPSGRNWYALYTRPNFEKRVDDDLKRNNIQSYLPLRSVLRQWSDRKKWIEIPLFSCYVFVKASEKERALSLEPSGVVCMLSSNGRPSRIPENEIELVRKMLEYDYNPEPVVEFIEGDAVEIISGPLAGLTGTYREHRGSQSLVVSFDGIGQAVSINIMQSAIKKLSHEKMVCATGE